MSMMVLDSLLIVERIVESLVGCSQPAVVVVVVKIEEESSLVQKAKRRTEVRNHVSRVSKW